MTIAAYEAAQTSTCQGGTSALAVPKDGDLFRSLDQRRIDNLFPEHHPCHVTGHVYHGNCQRAANNNTLGLTSYFRNSTLTVSVVMRKM